MTAFAEHARQALDDIRAREATQPIGYRGPAVCEVVGISYRQLDYWTTTGLITPHVRAAEGSGTQRLYSSADVVRLAVIKTLVDHGLSVQRIRQFIHGLSDGTLLAADGLEVIRSDHVLIEIYLVDLRTQVMTALEDVPAHRAWQDRGAA